MPKGWLRDRGESGSEGMTKFQRHVVKGIGCCLYACMCYVDVEFGPCGNLRWRVESVDR
jgi:hypothetical protein